MCSIGRSDSRAQNSTSKQCGFALRRCAQAHWDPDRALQPQALRASTLTGIAEDLLVSGRDTAFSPKGSNMFVWIRPIGPGTSRLDDRCPAHRRRHKCSPPRLVGAPGENYAWPNEVWPSCQHGLPSRYAGTPRSPFDIEPEARPPQGGMSAKEATHFCFSHTSG